MKISTWTFGILTSMLFLSGCNIKQTVSPVTSLSTKEVCIINNPPVRQGFLNEFVETLNQKGYRTKIIPQHSPFDSCKTVATYMGKWSWDMAIYMSLAEIKVYQNGKLVGTALYDSRSGSANMSKFIKAEEKIEELVGQLFP